MSELRALRLHSEPYAPTGNIGDGGFRRLLGTPSLEVLQLVVREAVQNSCDAARLGHGPGVTLRLRTLTAEQLTYLREHVLADLPFVDESRRPLERFLSSEQPRVLEIADFRTTGLGGPTRADRMPVGTERTDFIDFLRNVGTRRNTDQGGGTYGFGKASLYMASRCSTILVDTVTAVEDRFERRIMGCHLGPSGTRDTGDGYLTRYTGRHWWGVPADDDVTEPATGSIAEEIADRLGLMDRGPGDTGTTILVIDPDLGGGAEADDPDDDGDEGSAERASAEGAEDDVDRASRRLVASLLWNFWPRLMHTTPDDRRIQARVFLEHRELPMPAPEDAPPLDLFCTAMNMIRSGHEEARAVRKYGRILGRLAIARGVRGDRHELFDWAGNPFEAASAGIATMRPVELVVKVEPGTQLPDERVEWAGVFIASSDKDIEEAFARSEPAAHDTWDPATLTDELQRKWVRAALKRIRDAARAVAAPEPPRASGGADAMPLAPIAGLLGQFLKSRGHGGPTRSPGSGGGGGGGARRRSISAPVFNRLVLAGDEPAAEFTLILSGRGTQDLLVLEPVFSVEGGGLADEEVTGPRPRIIRIVDPSGGVTEGSGSAHVADQEGEVLVLVTVPPDCAVTVKAALETSR